MGGGEALTADQGADMGEGRGVLGVLDSCTAGGTDRRKRTSLGRKELGVLEVGLLR